MKRILILGLMALTLLVPTMAGATSTGSPANAYVTEITQVKWHEARTTQLADSNYCTLKVGGGTTGFGYVGVPETSQVYNAKELVFPLGNAPTMGFMSTFTSAGNADSIGIVVQYSPNGTDWFSTITVPAAGQAANVYLVDATATLGRATGILTEAASMATIPMWDKVRFIAQHWSGTNKAVAIANFKLWWVHFVKVGY